MTNSVPFSQEYVLSVTHENVLRAIDRSIRKTSARLGDEDMSNEKKFEILTTLTSLNRLHTLWEDIREENINLYEGNT